MRDLVEIKNRLQHYRDFSECVVHSVCLSDYVSVATITIDYTWTSTGEVRGDRDERLMIDLRFGLVQEFLMWNELPPSVTAHPTRLGWSQNEISMVVVQSDEQSSRYDHDHICFHRALLRREGSTWIEVVFAELEISERVAPADDA